MVLPAEPITCGKEPCSGLWLFIAPRYLPERICAHNWHRKEFGVPVSVSRHFPGSCSWKGLPAPGGLLQALLSLPQSLCPASLVPGALVQAEQCVNCWVQQGMCCLPWSWGLFLQVAFTFGLGGVQPWSPTAPGGRARWQLWVLGLEWGGGQAMHPLL